MRKLANAVESGLLGYRDDEVRVSRVGGAGRTGSMASEVFMDKGITQITRPSQNTSQEKNWPLLHVEWWCYHKSHRSTGISTAFPNSDSK